MSDDKNGAAQVIDKAHAGLVQAIVAELKSLGKVVDGDWSGIPVTKIPSQSTSQGGSAALPVMLSGGGGSGSRSL